MSLQEIQFLNENYMAGRDARLGAGAVPRVSPMLGGNTAFAEGFAFSSLTVSNLGDLGNTVVAIDINLGLPQSPDNFFFFIAREHGGTAGEAFGQFYIAPRTSSRQTNFEGVSVYKLHSVGSQVLGGDDPPIVQMYYYHLTEEVRSSQWLLIVTGTTGSGDLSLWDSFIGKSVQVRSTISSGLNYQLVDPSLIGYSDSGRQYSVRKPKYYQISSLNLPFINRNQRSALMRFYEQKGVTEPFWVAMDPDDHWDGPAFGPSFGAYRFESPPSFTHDFLDKFSVSMSLREAL